MMTKYTCFLLLLLFGEAVAQTGPPPSNIYNLAEGVKLQSLPLDTVRTFLKTFLILITKPIELELI